MRHYKLYKMIKEGRRVEDVRDELKISPSDLRALVILLKRMGLNVSRQGNKYVLREPQAQVVTLRSPVETLIATVQATKVLRFLHGEEVKMLWPNAVALKGEIIARVEAPTLRVSGVDPYIEAAVIKQVRDALRRKKIGEAVKTANELLYAEPYEIILNDGTEIRTKVLGVNVHGNARTEMGEIDQRAVRDVKLRS